MAIPYLVGSTILTMTTAPCRLFVYLAHDAPLGIVLRRGPSAWTRLSLWHTDTDVIEHGQWFRGRIYERRSDISTDGSLFLYFARKDGARSGGMDGVDSWLALSRPPWLSGRWEEQGPGEATSPPRRRSSWEARMGPKWGSCPSGSPFRKTFPIGLYPTTGQRKLKTCAP